ncbi:hypothetical protein LWC34_12310 [Kibdelosporangium philippinense]|uniref:Uncharacterized protein n=1 Tax=Kibdelosporangium philippinense TaxID=211113 RepID=A0ABS8ZAQ1_9PSEU|nr:hypothetical protein [Kibdelosporangium philippinense]MCE7003603.1 hypothetical protein [Kibdelosporangium philippinense]
MDVVIRQQCTNSFRREGEYWSLTHAADVVRLKHSKGVRYLAELLSRPGVEVHTMQLTAAVRQSSLGPVLDGQAKAAYRARIEDLREVIAEAESFHDIVRAGAARSELDALARQLAYAVGLGGRDRQTGSAAEKARINVTRALRTTIARIGQTLPVLGHHLDTSVRTGAFVSYQPGPAPAFTWQCDWS